MQQTTLATSQLGQTGLEITRVGFGAWAIGGGDWEFGWGAQVDAESVAAIERALELGVNWIDTAAAYGLGHSETIVRIGVSNFDVAQLRRADAIAPVETLQPPYSLAERAIEEEILPFAEREGIGVIAYSPMGSGLLTGAMTRERIAMLPENDWRKHDEHFTEPALSRHLATVERLETVVKRHDTTPGAVAIAWALSNPAVDAAIVGFRRPEQVDPLVPAANVELTPHDLAEIAAA